MCRVERRSTTRFSKQLSGLNADCLAADGHGSWLVQLLPEAATEALAQADYLGALSAPAAITLPPLRASDLRVGETITFPLDERRVNWLAQQLLDGATSVTVRLLYVEQGGGDTLFAWDAGMGS